MACSHRINSPKSIVEFDDINITAGNARYVQPKEHPFQLAHTDISIEPNWKNRSIDGSVSMLLSARAYFQDSIYIDAKRFIIKTVTMNEINEIPKNLNYFYDGKQLKIAFGRRIYPGNKNAFRINITYNARPLYFDSSYTKAPRGDQGLYFNNPDGIDSFVPKQIFTQGESRFNSCWFPTLDDPYQKMTQTLKVIRDTGMVSLSNGYLKYSKNLGNGKVEDFWEQDLPHSPYLAALVIGEYKKIHDSYKKIDVDYYVENQFSKYAMNIFGRTPKMIEFFENKFGYKFPWINYKQITARHFVSGAMENTTCVIHGDFIQSDSQAYADNGYESYICHELAHHWFGDLVTAKNWGNVAMNESFATFCELLWYEKTKSKEDLEFKKLQNFEGYFFESFYKKEPLINNIYNSPEDLFDKHRYDKGSLILWNLKSKLGDSIFFLGLKNYLKNNEFKQVDAHQFRNELEKVSGLDLDEYFQKSFFTKGDPKFEVTYSKTEFPRQGKIKVKQIQDKDEVFYNDYFPIRIVGVSNGKKVSDSTYQWRINKLEQDFSFSYQGEDYYYLLDPERNNIIKKKEEKSFGMWVNQFVLSKNPTFKYEAIKALSFLKTNKTQEDSLQKLVINPGLISKEKSVIWNVISNFINHPQSKYYPMYKVKIFDILRKDTASQCQLACLESIQSFGSTEDKLDAAKIAISLKSISVQDKGLQYILNNPNVTDTILKNKVFQKYRFTKNQRFVAPLARYLSRFKDKKWLSFIRERFFLANRYYRGNILADYEVIITKNNLDVLKSEMKFYPYLMNQFRDQGQEKLFRTYLINIEKALKESKFDKGKESIDEKILKKQITNWIDELDKYTYQ